MESADSILTIDFGEISVDVPLRMVAKAPAMYELLKEISDRSVFTDTSGLPIAMCLFCGAIGRGHEKDCRLAAVLKAVEGECPPPNTTD